MEYRLNKYISSSGVCSRREADRFIEEGKVTVNGKKATIGMRVLPGQQVKLNGNLIENDIEPVYIAFNKPVGIVTTTDANDNDNIIDHVGHEQRIFPIGRLDKDSQGLILLTNDGDIVNKILRAGNNHKKEYLVTVNRPITEEFIIKMSQGVPILDRVTRKCEVKQIAPYVFHITLIQGLNRQIRRMCEYFDYEVTKLERIRIMDIELGNLKQGNWRNLTEKELERLFDMIEDSEKTDTSSKNSANSSKNKKSSSKNSNSAKNSYSSKDSKSLNSAKSSKRGGYNSHTSSSEDSDNESKKETKKGLPARLRNSGRRASRGEFSSDDSKNSSQRRNSRSGTESRSSGSRTGSSSRTSSASASGSRTGAPSRGNSRSGSNSGSRTGSGSNSGSRQKESRTSAPSRGNSRPGSNSGSRTGTGSNSGSRQGGSRTSGNASNSNNRSSKGRQSSNSSSKGRSSRR